MGLLDDMTLGRHEPRESVLHRLDPRLKLCGFPLLVIAAFSGQEPIRLCALAAMAGALVLLSGIEWRICWRGIWLLRWLLLFTLLLHLFLSPGRTLFGVAWLSLDGLLRGGLVCAQLLLAVTYSSLLTLTTSPVDLARSCAALLAPFQRFGLPAREFASLLLLVLYFVPLLREEALAVHGESRAAGADSASEPLLDSARALSRMVAPLLLRLVERADVLARSLAAGEEMPGSAAPLEPFWPPGSRDLGALLVLAGSLLALWGMR